MNQAQRPAVVIWLKVYCLVMILICLVVAGLFMPLLMDPAAAMKGEQAYQENPEAAVAFAKTFAIILMTIFTFPVPFLLAGLVWPRNRAGFFIGITAIVAGFLTVCGWLATIPLVIFFCRENVRQYYGISTASADKANA